MLAWNLLLLEGNCHWTLLYHHTHPRSLIFKRLAEMYAGLKLDVKIERANELVGGIGQKSYTSPALALSFPPDRLPLLEKQFNRLSLQKLEGMLLQQTRT